MRADIHYGQEHQSSTHGPDTDVQDQSLHRSHRACNTRPVAMQSEAPPAEDPGLHRCCRSSTARILRPCSRPGIFRARDRVYLRPVLKQPVLHRTIQNRLGKAAPASRAAFCHVQNFRSKFGLVPLLAGALHYTCCSVSVAAGFWSCFISLASVSRTSRGGEQQPSRSGGMRRGEGIAVFFEA